MDDKEYKYELFFEISPDLLCIAGYDGYFKKVNAAVSNTLGYSFEELYSKPINDFVYHQDKDITSLVRGDLTRSKPLYNFENRYISKNGEIIWLSWTSLPVESEQVIFAIAKNITHRKKLEEERSELLLNLTKVNKDLKQLSYTTSHDLRSPVNNLLTGLELIDTSLNNDEETIELIEILKSSGKYIKKTLNNYVDTLSEKLYAPVDIEEVEFNESLSAVLKSIISLIQTSKVKITTNFTEIDKVEFNKAYMESILLNLITNSIKYSRRGVPPEISIVSKKINGTIQLIFTDNGLGFNMNEVKDKIFGLHQTFHNNKDSKGIGLYLVQNHITSLGGKIDVKSKVNEGTKFTITFKKPTT